MPDDRLALKVPHYFWVSNWDLESKAYALEEAKKAAKFKLAFPVGKPLGLERRRIVRASGSVPAFMAVYQRGPSIALISAFRFANKVPAYGIPLQTTKKGRLVLSPLLSSFSFVHEGTTYIVLGNLPFEDILALGDKVDA